MSSQLFVTGTIRGTNNFLRENLFTSTTLPSGSCSRMACGQVLPCFTSFYLLVHFLIDPKLKNGGLKHNSNSYDFNTIEDVSLLLRVNHHPVSSIFWTRKKIQALRPMAGWSGRPLNGTERLSLVQKKTVELYPRNE